MFEIDHNAILLFMAPRIKITVKIRVILGGNLQNECDDCAPVSLIHVTSHRCMIKAHRSRSKRLVHLAKQFAFVRQCSVRINYANI